MWRRGSLVGFGGVEDLGCSFGVLGLRFEVQAIG